MFFQLSAHYVFTLRKTKVILSAFRLGLSSFRHLHFICRQIRISKQKCNFHTFSATPPLTWRNFGTWTGFCLFHLLVFDYWGTKCKLRKTDFHFSSNFKFYSRHNLNTPWTDCQLGLSYYFDCWKCCFLWLSFYICKGLLNKQIFYLKHWFVFLNWNFVERDETRLTFTIVLKSISWGWRKLDNWFSLRCFRSWYPSLDLGPVSVCVKIRKINNLVKKLTLISRSSPFTRQGVLMRQTTFHQCIQLLRANTATSKNDSQVFEILKSACINYPVIFLQFSVAVVEFVLKSPVLGVFTLLFSARMLSVFLYVEKRNVQSF